MARKPAATWPSSCPAAKPWAMRTSSARRRKNEGASRICTVRGFGFGGFWRGVFGDGGARRLARCERHLVDRYLQPENRAAWRRRSAVQAGSLGRIPQERGGGEKL